MKLSDKIAKVQPSATLSITSKAKSLLAAGEDVVILAAGEPDFDTPDVIKEAAIQAINDGKTKYTPASGTLSLKKAICRKLKNDNGLSYETSNIVVSNGAKHSIYNALQAICNAGDEVLVVSPYWLSYPEMVRLAGAEPREINAARSDGYKITPEQIKKASGPKTRALILNSPSNPAGVVYNDDELAAIANVCVEAGMIIISDEIYEKILYDGKEHVSVASVSSGVKDMTVVINGVSKSYSMTGWRIGYMAAPSPIASMVSTLQSHATSNPCSVSQAAAECALTADLDGEMKKNREKFEKRRDSLLELLSRESRIIPFKPEGAFYMFCDISAFGMSSLDFSKRLLEEKKVAVIPGGPFGDDNSIRISFASDIDNITKGVERMLDWAGKL